MKDKWYTVRVMSEETDKQLFCLVTTSAKIIHDASNNNKPTLALTILNYDINEHIRRYKTRTYLKPEVEIDGKVVDIKHDKQNIAVEYGINTVLYFTNVEDIICETI